MAWNASRLQRGLFGVPDVPTYRSVARQEKSKRAPVFLSRSSHNSREKQETSQRVSRQQEVASPRCALVECAAHLETVFRLHLGVNEGKGGAAFRFPTLAYHTTHEKSFSSQRRTSLQLGITSTMDPWSRAKKKLERKIELDPRHLFPNVAMRLQCVFHWLG